MASRQDYEDNRKIEELKRRGERPRLIYVSLTWEVYERDEEDRPRKAETINDLHVLIDRVTGQRLIVDDRDLDGDATFITLARHAEAVPLVYSITRKQLAAVINEHHRVIAAFGGEGGGKTQALGLWMVRTWLRVGGAQVRLWWVAPAIEQTRICVEKLITGEDQRPPLIPPELVTSYPANQRSNDQSIRLIDGTKIELRYASGQRAGGNLKGRRPRAIGIDEACELKHVRLWKLIRGRVTRARHFDADTATAQIFLSSTPEEGHWAEREIVVRVDAGEDTEATYTHLTQWDNPWIPIADINAAIEAKGGLDDPQVKRDLLGQWASSTDRAFYRFSVRRSCRDFDDLEALGLDDVTAAVVRERWPRLPEQVIHTAAGGQDFNLSPCVTIVAKFGVPKGRPYSSEGDLVVVVVGEYTTQLEGYEQHGWGLRKAWGALPISCDATGAQTGAMHDLRGAEAATHARRLARAGHSVQPCAYSRNGEPFNPSVPDSLEQVNEIAGATIDGIPRMIVHRRCRRLLDGLQLAKSTPDRRFAKRSGDAQDKLTAAPDGLRYLMIRAMPESFRARIQAA